MRRHKFKAWHPDDNVMTKFFYLEDLSGGFIDGIDITKENVIRRQSTELFDKNGIEIVEGDRVQNNLLVNDTVIWKDGGFRLELADILPAPNLLGSLWAVVGNIHQNP